MKKCLAYAAIVAGMLLTSCGGTRHYTLEVVAEYPHDAQAYTQGLFFSGGQLFESTGQYGESTFRKVDLESGEVLESIGFDDRYFAEGSVRLGDRIYMLTWQNEELFELDAETLEVVRRWNYPREGWGLTTDGEQLIASDGSAHIYFMDRDLQQTRRITVRNEGRAVRWLNELEYIDGKIWANVYTSDIIVIIDPADGKVTGVIDCAGLLPQHLWTRGTDVLNGIAYDDTTGKIYLAGKNWPRLYEVRLVRNRF